MMKNNSLRFFILAVALFVGSCGSSSTSTQQTFGPVGPTWPNNYYFNLVIYQTVVTTPDVNAVVNVWTQDALGNKTPVNNVPVFFGGDIQALTAPVITGAAQSSTTSVGTGSGVGTGASNVTTATPPPGSSFLIDVVPIAIGPGMTGRITASIDNLTITGLYEVKP